MDNIPLFGDRKNGRAQIEYPHPLLEGILAETYGIFVYQEQVMQAVQILAGYHSAARTCCAGRWARRSSRRWTPNVRPSSRAAPLTTTSRPPRRTSCST